MKSEFYVIQLIRCDEVSRMVVAQILGLPVSTPTDQLAGELARLGAAYRLGIQLHCNPQDVFVEIQRQIDQSLYPVDELSSDDFYWIDWHEARKEIARLLGCEIEDVMQRLFDAELLEELLLEAGVIDAAEAAPHKGDSEWLVNKLRSPEAVNQIMAFSGSSNQWELLRDLLRTQAREELSRLLHCPYEDPLPYLVAHNKALTGQVRQREEHPPGSSGETLDFIGISKLRNMMHTFQHHILEKARNYAELSRRKLPAYKAPNLLPVLINYWLGRQYRLALEDLLRGQQTIRELNCQVVDAGIGVEPHTQLQPVVVPRQDVEDRADLVVRCAPQADGIAVELVRLVDLKRAEAEHICLHLPKSVDQLAGTGATLVERLLNTTVPLFSAWKRGVRAALLAESLDGGVDVRLVQTFVLAQASLRPKEIAPKLPLHEATVRPREAGLAVHFPRSSADMAADLRQEYRERGIELRTV